MTIRRILIVILIAVIMVPTIILALFIADFDPNRYAPALTAAVQKATGRQLTFGSPIKLSISLSPEISVDNVSLANPPGFADPSLVTISRIQARIALLPLFRHHINIVRLVILRPDVVLETTGTGTADWDLKPDSGAAGPVTSGPAAPPGRYIAGYRIALESVNIQGGSVVIRPGHSKNSVTVALVNVTGTSASPSSPLQLNARAYLEGVPIELNGVLGPVARFSGTGTGPWPIDLTFSSHGATATVEGNVIDPRKPVGYDLSVQFAIPALETLTDSLPSGFLNGPKLPPIHGIMGSAEFRDEDSSMPAITHLVIKAGASDLSSFRPDLKLIKLDIEAPSLTSPFSISATGAIGATPMSLVGNFGAPSLFINPAWLPPGVNPPVPNFPISVQVQAGNNKLDIDGGIATPMTLAGAAISVKMFIPELSSLSALAGASLPGWKNITAQGTLIDPGGLGLLNAIGIDSLVLEMDNAALGGDLIWYFGNHPRLRVALKAQQINLDPLLAALPAAPLRMPPTTPSPEQHEANYLVPPAKLPLAILRAASADIQLSADRLIFHHATYAAIQSYAVLANGVLTISPVTALIPGGSVAASATVDASKEPAEATLSFDAPALALSPFLNALGLPSAAEGTLQAGMSASGTGDNLQDLAGTVQGELGLAMVNGTVDGEVLSRLFVGTLTAVDLPAGLVGAQGPVNVRCFGLRIDAENGIGRVSALTLDSNRLLVQGGGSLNFGNETLGLIIRPQLRVAGDEIGVPVKVGGTFVNPTASVAPLAAVQEAAKTAVGLTVSLAEEIPGAGGLLGKIEGKIGSPSAGDVCPAALSLARLGKPGPAAPAEFSPVSADANGGTAITGPKSLLNALLGN